MTSPIENSDASTVCRHQDAGPLTRPPQVIPAENSLPPLSDSPSPLPFSENAVYDSSLVTIQQPCSSNGSLQFLPSSLYCSFRQPQQGPSPSSPASGSYILENTEQSFKPVYRPVYSSAFSAKSPISNYHASIKPNNCSNTCISGCISPTKVALGNYPQSSSSVNSVWLIDSNTDSNSNTSATTPRTNMLQCGSRYMAYLNESQGNLLHQGSTCTHNVSLLQPDVLQQRSNFISSGFASQTTMLQDELRLMQTVNRLYSSQSGPSRSQRNHQYHQQQQEYQMNNDCLNEVIQQVRNERFDEFFEMLARTCPDADDPEAVLNLGEVPPMDPIQHSEKGFTGRCQSRRRPSELFEELVSDLHEPSKKRKRSSDNDDVNNDDKTKKH